MSEFSPEVTGIADVCARAYVKELGLEPTPQRRIPDIDDAKVIAEALIGDRPKAPKE